MFLHRWPFCAAVLGLSLTAYGLRLTLHYFTALRVVALPGVDVLTPHHLTLTRTRPRGANGTGLSGECFPAMLESTAYGMNQGIDWGFPKNVRLVVQVEAVKQQAFSVLYEKSGSSPYYA